MLKAYKANGKAKARVNRAFACFSCCRQAAKAFVVMVMYARVLFLQMRAARSSYGEVINWYTYTR